MGRRHDERGEPRCRDLFLTFLCLLFVCAVMPAMVWHRLGASGGGSGHGLGSLKRDESYSPSAMELEARQVSAKERRVAMVIPYVGGRLPSFFKLFAASCGHSGDGVDYLVMVSDPKAIPSDAAAFVAGTDPTPPAWLPRNVKFFALGANRFARLHARIPSLGLESSPFPDDSELDAAEEPLAVLMKETFSRNGRHLVEFGVAQRGRCVHTLKRLLISGWSLQVHTLREVPLISSGT